MEDKLKTYRAHLLVCAGTGCVSNRSYRIRDALEKEIVKRGLEKEVLIVMTGCNGFCERGPIIVVQPDGIFYQQLTEEDVPYLVEEHLLKGRPVKKLMYQPEKEAVPVPKMSDIEFFKHQRLIVLRHRGLIDPEKIDEYIAFDGYRALGKALTEMNPEEIIQEVKKSGLRGRGGAGFPTGMKWEFCRNAKGNEKYIICNADEGDPGAFMDRSVLEADPHAVLEGMLIGARAMGAHAGYIYIRDEYPLALQRVNVAIEQAREYGLIGENIFDTDFSFDFKVIRGGGAFVCGEETALIASIEGKIGRPRQRPPFPAQKGLWGKPTNNNNVETWANIPPIIERGGDWFSQIGTEKSKGTKIFSLVGKVNNTGLVEVPMGITLRDIIYGIGGGIPDGKEFKAVQSGGPSGGCIPKELIDLPVDYERLTEAGAIMGSGGLIVMDETTCMVDLAKFFLDFIADESCGKCTPCRLGTKVMLNILNDITEGRGKEGDIELLEELSQNIKELSLCGLGQTAPNPVLTTIRYFRDEYEAHIKEKWCPTSVCKRLVPCDCQHACPVGLDVPSYVALIAHGRFQEALDLIREDNPFPGICGRVCTHPCEGRCKRGEDDDPVSIRFLKRFLADWELAHPGKKPTATEKTREEQVAIIGSGPAGLTAAHDLALRGYKTTVFEALPVAGGMLTVGIPEYRLPQEIIRAEIEAIEALGVDIKLNTTIGKDLTLDELREHGYKAIFIATGAYKGLKLGIPGEDEYTGVLDCISFLKQVNLGDRKKPGDKVIIIGGGNAAVDSARTALRLGSKEVNIVYRRSRQEMPAHESEIQATEEEGVKINYLAAPVKILGKDGKVTGMECIKMELGEPDASGRRRPIPIEGSEFTIDADAVIPAISQEPDLSFLPLDKIKVTKWNLLVVNEQTLETTLPGVFAGGDVVSGPAAVIDAIAAGQRAAVSIDNYLRGEKEYRGYKRPRPKRLVEAFEITEEMEGVKRAK
ncbi:MAG: NADH-quinone oxidoreductase subunit NuoF, partial [Deltaproteobacteria bacterium]